MGHDNIDTQGQYLSSAGDFLGEDFLSKVPKNEHILLLKVKNITHAFAVFCRCVSNHLHSFITFVLV